MATFEKLHFITDVEVNGEILKVPAGKIINLDCIVAIAGREEFPPEMKDIKIANAGIILGSYFNVSGGNETVLVTETPEEIMAMAGWVDSNIRSNDSMIEVVTKSNNPVSFWVSDIKRIQAPIEEVKGRKSILILTYGALECAESVEDITCRVNRALEAAANRKG